MASYTDAADVNQLLGPHAATASTTPSLTDLGEFVDEVEAEVNVALAGAGVDAIPVTGDATFQTYLGFVVQWGAAAAHLKGMCQETTGPGESPAFRFWEVKYQAALKLLRDGTDIPTALMAGGDDNPLPTSYFTRNPDTEEDLGDIAEPFFKRSTVL